MLSVFLLPLQTSACYLVKNKIMNSIKKDFSQPITVPYLLLTVAFATSIVIANLIEIKTVDLGWFTTTAGVLVFPFSYIINDCVVEVYGLARARMMIWIGLLVSMAVSLFLQIAIWLPGSEEWNMQEAMSSLYGAVPRVMGASFLAFLTGSMINAWVMNRMKQNAGNNRSFSLRAIVSTIWGEGFDSLVFFPVAFGGILPFKIIISLIVTQTLIKTIYEILVLPVTIRVVHYVQGIEKGLEAPAA